MDHFSVIYEIDGVKEWWTVVARNTMHAKDIIRDQYPYDNVIFIDVDFAGPEQVKMETK